MARPKTLSMRQIQGLERIADATAMAALEREPRPTSRADCEPCLVCQEWRDLAIPGGPADDVLPCGHDTTHAIAHTRPCIFVGCKHHLLLEVNSKTGALRMTFPGVEPDQMDETCALDVAEEDGATLYRVGRLINLTRERVRQIEVKAINMAGSSSERDDLTDADGCYMDAAEAMMPPDPLSDHDD